MKVLVNFILLFWYCVIILILSCSDKKAPSDAGLVNNSDNDTIINDEIVSYPSLPFFDCPEINYNLVELTSSKQIKEIISKYSNDSINGPAYRKTLRTLNRKELRFFRVGDKVIIPDTFFNDMRYYSIFAVGIIF